MSKVAFAFSSSKKTSSRSGESVDEKDFIAAVRTNLGLATDPEPDLTTPDTIEPDLNTDDAHQRAGFQTATEWANASRNLVNTVGKQTRLEKSGAVALEKAKKRLKW